MVGNDGVNGYGEGVAARASIGAGGSTRVHQNPSTAVGFNGPQRRARFPRRKLRTRHGDSVTSSAREGKGSAVRGPQASEKPSAR